MRLFFRANRHFFSCLIVIIVFIYGCKEPDNVGLEVLPKSDLSSLNFSDTFTLQTSVVREDSVPASGNSANLVGVINDNLFGISRASFYTQVWLSSFNVNFGSGAICDSVILTLAYSGYYGDTTTAHNFEVYRLNENILTDTVYYSNRTFSAPDLLGSLSTSDIRPTDSIDGKAPHLRIPLDKNILGPAFLNPSSSAVYESNSAFKEYFKGIYVKDASSPSTGGCILYFALKDTMSKITLYYNSGSSFTFPFPGVTAPEKINHFEHDYSTAIFGNNFNDPDFGKNLSYVQSMAGIKTKIGFPFLNDLVKSGNISINKAELVITIDNTTTSTYSAHSSLFLVGIDSGGSGYFLPDAITSASNFGGAQTNGTYTFLITRYIQQILTGARKDYGLFLVASGASANANRTVIGGSGNSSIPLKLKLSYTNINP
jgi:uncharacterized protein DUF4270